MEVGSTFPRIMRIQLIPPDLSVRWLGHLLGTFYQYKTRNQL